MSTIWMIIPSFDPVVGGEETQVKYVSKALRADGWPIQVLTRRQPYAHVKGLSAKDQVDGIPVTRIYSSGAAKIGSLLYLLLGMWHLLRHGRGDIYHANDDYRATRWLTLAARYVLGGRCIIKLRTGRQAYEQRCLSRLARWEFSTSLRLADRVSVLNTEVQRFVAELGVPAERVVKIVNGVDTNYFCPASIKEKLAARRRLDLPIDIAVVLFMGRLNEVKRVDLLLRAWASLPQRIRADAQLVVVGDGAEWENLLKLRESHQIEASVALTGMKQNVRDYYWAADAFVLPSRTEGLSVALIEAMACGIPVVASNVGGALDIVEEYKNGFLFQSGNHCELAQKLASILDMRHQWPEMGGCARRTAVAYADLGTTVNRLKELYSELGIAG